MITHILRKTAAYCIACLLLFALCHCGKTETLAPQAQVKPVHAQPQISALYAELNADNTTEPLNYNTAAAVYYPIQVATQNNLRFYQAETNNLLLNLSVKQVSANAYYSLLLLPDDTYNLTAVWLTDSLPNTPALPTDSIKLRFIHASPDAGELRVYTHLLPADTLFEAVSFNPASPAAMTRFAKLAPLTAPHNFTIVSALTNDTLAQFNGVPLQAGGSFSLVLSGYSLQSNMPLTYQLVSHQP